MPGGKKKLSAGQMRALAMAHAARRRQGKARRRHAAAATATNGVPAIAHEAMVSSSKTILTEAMQADPTLADRIVRSLLHTWGA